MDYEEIKVHKLEHPINGWGAKKVDEFLLKSDVDEWADEQKIAYEDLDKRLSKTIANKESRIKELEEHQAMLESENEDCTDRINDDNNRFSDYERKIKELNIGLENAENAYYYYKMELDNAKARINELVDRCSSLVSQNEMLESNYKEMTRDRDWCKERIKELEAENAALRKTNKFNNEMLIESIKELAKEGK